MGQEILTTVVLTNALEQWPWELIATQVVRVSTFYGSWRPIIIFTGACHWILLCACPAHIFTFCLFKIHLNILPSVLYVSHVVSFLQVFLPTFCIDFKPMTVVFEIFLRYEGHSEIDGNTDFLIKKCIIQSWHFTHFGKVSCLVADTLPHLWKMSDDISSIIPSHYVYDCMPYFCC